MQWPKRAFRPTITFATVPTLIAVSALLALSGCGDDDGPTDPPGGNEPPELRDLSLTLNTMNPHVGQKLEFRVVSDGGDLESRIYLDPLPGPDYMLEVPKAVQEGGHRLDFFADHNGNGSYDAPPADHAWRIALGSTGSLAPDFTHNTSFTDIGSPAGEGDFSLVLTGMTPHVGQLFELRVKDTETGQTVGQYRLGAVLGADFTVDIPGVIETGRSYTVDFYADMNGDGEYDAPPADHAWRETGVGTASGLTVAFTHATNFTDIAFGDSGGPFDPNVTPTFSQIQSEILTPRCVNSGCHPGGGAPMSLAAGSAYGNMVGVASAYGMDRVTPGSPFSSVLYLKVIGDSETGQRMPPSGSLTADQIEMIRAWIEAGAAND
ncbi:MAG: hypothetical protein R3E97_03795 [Candidatus Eisenbacteria bacterium]